MLTPSGVVGEILAQIWRIEDISEGKEITLKGFVTLREPWRTPTAGAEWESAMGM